MVVITRPMAASTSTMRVPLMTAWVVGASPLIQPAGPDCGLRIQAVIMVAATPPMMMARICWSLNRFFIGLARIDRAPHHGDALRARKLDQHPRRRQAEDGAGGVAL